MAGASWVQQRILEKHPTADLQVYVIWFSMLPTDDRGEWDEDLLDDPRVIHLWDPDQEAGRWFADDDNIDLGYDGNVLWDAYLLFDRDANWESAPSHLIGWGRTVIGRSADLEDELVPLLQDPPGTASAGDATPPGTPKTVRSGWVGRGSRLPDALPRRDGKEMSDG